jgi:hypothetical protein
MRQNLDLASRGHIQYQISLTEACPALVILCYQRASDGSSRAGLVPCPEGGLADAHAQARPVRA